MASPKKIRQLVLDDTKNSISHDRYKTTSFTLLKEDYQAFNDACKKSKRKPSEVLRSLAKLFTQGVID
jgi:hypothetical protein